MQIQQRTPKKKKKNLKSRNNCEEVHGFCMKKVFFNK